MEYVYQLRWLLEIHFVLLLLILWDFIQIRRRLNIRLISRKGLPQFFLLHSLQTLPSLLFAEFWWQTFKEVFILFQVLKSLPFWHVLACQICLNLKLLLDDGDFFVFLSCLSLRLLYCITGLLLMIIEVIIERLHIFL